VAIPVQQAFEIASRWILEHAPDLTLLDGDPENYDGLWLFSLGRDGTSPHHILLGTPPLAVNQETGEADWFMGGSDAWRDDDGPRI
jgi:hypothetical protein